MAPPTRYRAEYAEQARKLCRLGATDVEIGDFLGVSDKTVRNWRSRHPAFAEAVRDGKQMADAEVADKLFRRATGYSHEAVKIFNAEGSALVVPYTEHYPPDTVACIFWLKNRRPDLWRDKQELAHSGVTVQVLRLCDGDDPAA